MKGKTTIQISRDLKKFLDSKGKKGESYDQILHKLLFKSKD